MQFSARRVATLAGLSVLLATGCGGSSPVSQSMPAETVARLDKVIDDFLRDADAPGVVVALWVPGQGTYLRAAGYADERTKTPMTGREYFRIGSITKTVTVTAILQLVEDGKIQLDDPIGKYVDGVPNGNTLTLRQLANMTSGLSSYTANDAFVDEIFAHPERIWRPRELVEVAFKMDAEPPGTVWDYINTNTVLLQMVVEKVTGKPLPHHFQTRIFDPLGMRGTKWYETGFMPRPYASGVTRQTLDGSRADATHRSPSWGQGAGQLISNLNDLKIWVEAYTRPGFISDRMFRERITWATLPPNTAEVHYGLGIGEDHGWRGHTGELPGYNTGAYHLPSQNATMIIMVNSDIPPAPKKNPVPVLMNRITKIITPGNVTRE